VSGYIGLTRPVVTPGAERKKTFAVTSTQTVFTGLSYTPEFVHVYHNGVRLVDGTDYTATNGNSITLTSAAENGDEVVVISFATFQAANAYTKSESDDRYRDSVAADILPDTDSSRDLGSSSKAWAEAHVGDLYLPEQASAPSTSANEGAVYTKQSGGQSELFYREESDGDEVQITNGGILNAVPSGSVTWFAADSPPTGWLECDGSAISRTTYAALFSAIGTTFGVGDGSTTFDLPDLRGEFIRGWDNGRGVDSGRAFGSFQDHAFQSHAHLESVRSSTGGTETGNGFTNGSFFTPSGGAPYSGNVSTETRPRNRALLPIIKY